MTTLPSILHCNPADSPHCFGTCTPAFSSSSQEKGIGERCLNKLSRTSISRAVQVLETGSALFRADKPLRQCLQQLAPLVLCVRNHQGRDQMERLMRIWWWRILDEKEGRYWWDMVSAFRKMGRDLEDEDLEDEDLEDLEDYLEEEEEEEEGNGSPTETSQSTPTSTSTTQPRLPPPPRPLQIKRYSRARFATLTGLRPDHVFPKVPVQEECGICLDMLGVSRAEGLAAATSPSTSDASDSPRSTTNNNNNNNNNNAAVTSEQDSPSLATSGDFWAEYDCTQWIWCKGSCGTTYHKECLDQWVDTVRYDEKPGWPTCPGCRMYWVF